MADDTIATPETPATVTRRKPLPARIALWIAGALGVLVVLLLAIVFALNTQPGHRFLANRIGDYTTESGISIHPGRIEGSIFGDMTIFDLAVNDQKGAFLTVPKLEIDWRPFAYAHKLIDVRSAVAGEATLLRSPALKPTPPPKPDEPLLPDIDLALGQLRVDRFTIEPAVDGKRHLLSINGKAALAQGRAQIDVGVRAVDAPGLAGGDNFRLKLDAVPKENRLLVDLKLAAPAGGLVDSYAHLGKSLALSLDGHGDWANWHGALRAQAGTTPLVDLGLTGQNGHFQFKGRAVPNAILAAGPVTRLTAPEVDVTGSVVLGQRNADVVFAAHSSALAVDAQGLVNLANNSLGNFRLGVQLLTPGSIAQGVNGRDVRLDAVIDGAIATPTIDYKLSAGALGFNAIAIEGLRASGHATVDAMHILVPIAATAQRVSGLNAAAGGLLTHLSANGTVAYANGKLLTDNLALKSDRINATVIAIADLTRGTYTGALKGRVNDYQIDGLGRVNLETDAHLVPAKNGGFGIVGWVHAQTTRIDNASVRQFLGGNALFTANVGYSADSVASLSNLQVNAPALHIAGGEGRYMSDGRILFRANGTSKQYGPFSLDANGTVAKPVVHLHADRPNVGVQLSNVDARLSGNGAGGYEVVATGGSPYGPFAGDVVIMTAKGPLRLNIKSAQFAGIKFAGALVQTPTGPFAGALTLNGSGFNGRVQLAAADKIQRADVSVTASAAHVPGPTATTIGAGIIKASVLLYPGAPSITADAHLTDVRQGPTIISNVQARVRYQQGRGTVAVVAAGHASVPFNLAAQAAIDPGRIVVNARGSASNIAFSLAGPATIIKTGNDWRLGNTTIMLPNGQVVLSGSYGARTQVHAAIVNLDLAIIQAVAPGLTVGGKATGTVDFAMDGSNAIPVSQTRLDIAGFTRTGALTVSDPLNLAVLAKTGADGANVSALIRRGTAIVGRAQARIAPGGGAAWTERLMHGSLAGGIRYAGPAELLWTLSGIAGQEVSGPVALAADFGGRVEQPSLTGVVRADHLRYENDTYGTVISNIVIDGRFTQSALVLNQFTGKAGDGTVSASGSASIDATAGYPINLNVKLANARLAKSDALGATVTGQIAVTNSKAAGGAIQGDIQLGEARYQIIRQGAAEVPELTGVHRKGVPLQTAAAADAGPAPSRWKLNLRIHAPGRIFVSGMGLEAEWSTDMRITGTAGAPAVVGELDVVRGTFSFSGKNLDLDNTSKVTFDGGSLTNPVLAITANTTVSSVTATIAITGRAQQPQIAFTSTPALPQDEVLSRLLFGTSVTSLSPTEAVQLAAALNSLRGSGGGFNPLGKIRSVAGFDRLRILGANPATGQGTSLAAGKYIARNVYVEVVTDGRGFTATQLEIALSKALSVLSSTGSFGGSNASLRYRRDH
ncbi:translocation/assembly module TamB domain-containing protein [Novosphingobium sp.]|uniref:translocation/assembly module TamB domain-containing protein n=1 Tax=Novosphingobium sp. TaxID=1874826 RepID=UPI003D0A06F8